MGEIQRQEKLWFRMKIFLHANRSFFLWGESPGF